MKYDISGILKVNGSSADVNTAVELDLERLNGYQIDKIDNARFKGTISNNSGIIKLSGILEVDYTTCCGRCLKPLHNKTDLGIDECFSKREIPADEEIYKFEGTQIPMGEALTESFLLNLPVRNLCKEDCRGLCTVCGANLNETECGCDREHVNSKFEVLKSIFEKD